MEYGYSDILCSLFCETARFEMQLRGKSVRSWCDESSDRSFMVDPLSYFSFHPALHDWCNKGRGMWYPVCGMVHIKEPLLSIEKSSPCGGSRFPISLSEWSFYHMSERAAGRQFNVAKTTLHDRLSGKMKLGAKPGKPPSLTKEKETKTGGLCM